jgi:chemotaxis protein methyltransferase CheR
MMAALDRTLLGEVSSFIAGRMGLNFPEERWPDLARGLQTASEDLGFEQPDAYMRWLIAGELTTCQVRTLAGHLTVGETYFFRDPASFEALRQEILPPLVALRRGEGRTLRLWSAGCCTGEEPYSLAITCARVLPDLQAWNVSILATDINPRFLAKAEAGVYSKWSFRGAPGRLGGQFFRPAPDEKFAIDAAVRKLVQFSYLNLAEDTYPLLHEHTNAMDVILCRNVLMYFTPDHQRRAASALHRCLVDGGYLLVNPAEASASLFPMFATENIGGVIFYRKTSQPARIESGPVSPVPPPAVPMPEAVFLAAATPPVPVAPALPIAAAARSPREDPLVVARTCANQGRLEDALTSCQDAIAAGRTDVAAHFLHATICHELGRFEEAVAALGKVLYLDQDFILAHHALGGLYERLGKQRESRRHRALALELLAARSRDEIVPESGGMTCGRLMESVRANTGPGPRTEHVRLR